MDALARFNGLHRHEFSKTAADEVLGYIRRLLSDQPGPVDGFKVDLGAIPHFARELAIQRRVIDHQSRHIIFDPIEGIEKVKEQAALAWIVANILGEPMVQNHQGRRLVEVYDREGKTMQEGARYHQSRQGDNPHTDSTNDPAVIDYVILSCGAPAAVGGETIIVDGFALYETLQDFPDVLKTLSEPFWFENRGMAAEDRLFKMPVVSLDDRGEPRIRYLRPYMESAQSKSGQPFTRAQIDALNTLDAILELSELQHRVMLGRGETLVAIDTQILHARTNFVDRRPPGTIEMETADLAEINRYLLRVWVKRTGADGAQKSSLAA